MNKKILFVDDDLNILSAYKRLLRKEFQMETASNGEQALHALDNMGPFAVVMSDMRLPDMDGIQFLARVKTRSPDSVRIMITGNVDLQIAIHAVNEGNVFCFLTKPCSSENLAKSLNSGLRQHQLIVTEHELLSKTLTGSVRALINVLRMLNPAALSRISNISGYAKMIAAKMNFPNLWQIELASMLSQIGCVFLSPRIPEKIGIGQALSQSELEIYSSHPSNGAGLVANIPRLKPVARIIEQQQKPFKDYALSNGATQESNSDLGAQILKVAIDLDLMILRGQRYEAAIDKLRNHPGDYNPRVVIALESLQMGKIFSPKDRDSGKGDEANETHGSEDMTIRPAEIRYDIVADQDSGTPFQFIDQKKLPNISNGDIGITNAVHGMEETDEDHKKIRPVNLRISIEAEGDIRATDGTLLLSKGQKVSPLMQYAVERMNSFFRRKKDGIKKPGEDSDPADAGPNMILDRDITASDGTLFLHKGQEATPLIKDILKHSKEFLQTSDYKIVFVDAEGKTQILNQDDDSASSLVKYQNSPRSRIQEAIIDRLRDILQTKEYRAEDLEVQIRQIEVSEFKPGMVTCDDIWANNGILLLSKGQEITGDSLRHLRNFSQTVGLKSLAFSILTEVNNV